MPPTYLAQCECSFIERQHSDITSGNEAFG
jgi:hypothetical protein